MPFFGGGQGDYHIVVTNIKGGTDAAPAVVGSNNMALGNASLESAEGAFSNIAIGNNAGTNVVDGSNNVFLGYNAGDTAIGSINNVIIGADSDVYFTDPGASNLVAIGFESTALDDGTSVGRNAYSFARGVRIGGNAPGSENAAAVDAVAIGYESNAGPLGIALGSNTVATDGGIAIGSGVALTVAGQIQIGQGTELDVQLGAYDMATVPVQGSANFWTTDYLAVGLDNVSASVNGSVVNAKLGLWVDDGGTNNVGAGIGKADSTAANAGATMFVARSRGTLAAPAVIQNADLIGSLIGIGYDGTDYATAARIDFEVDGVPGNDDMPGRMVFKVAPDGSQTVAEAMRISQNKDINCQGNLAVKNGMIVPYIAAQWGVPSGVAPSGVIANNGALTLGTALSRVYSGGLFLAFPAGAIEAGSAAGSYWCVMSSTTAGTIYNNALNGIPAIPAALVPFVTVGPGAYGGRTDEVNVGSFTLPGGSLGPNGQITGRYRFSRQNTASNIAFRGYFGSSALFGINNPPSVASFQIVNTIVNNGLVNSQSTISGASDTASGIAGTVNVGNIDTTNNVNVAISVQTIVATEWAINESANFLVQYGA